MVDGINVAYTFSVVSTDECPINVDIVFISNNTINLTQYKTRKELTLPLLAEVGDAIIDYVKYGRPVSKSKTIFLSAHPPYGQISASGISSIVTCCIYEIQREASWRSCSPP